MEISTGFTIALEDDNMAPVISNRIHNVGYMYLHGWFNFVIFMWVFPKIGVPQNGWFIMENSLKWMIWRYRHLRKHPHYINYTILPEPMGLFGFVYECFNSLAL